LWLTALALKNKWSAVANNKHIQAGFPCRLSASVIRSWCGSFSGEALVNSRPKYVPALGTTKINTSFIISV
jgi:hypothetical protein